MMKMCVPSQGDIVELSYRPAKEPIPKIVKKPGMIISSESYYKTTGLLLICRISDWNDTQSGLHIKYGGNTFLGNIVPYDILTLDPSKKAIYYIETADKKTVNNVLKFIGMFF